MNCESPNRCYWEWAFAGPRDAIRLLKRDRRKHSRTWQACTDYISTQNTTYMYFSSPIRLIKKVYTCSPQIYTQCRLSLVVIASLKCTKLQLPFQQRNESLLHESVNHLLSSKLARQTFISHSYSYWSFTIKIGCQRVKTCLSAILVYNRTQKNAKSCTKCCQSDS